MKKLIIFSFIALLTNSLFSNFVEITAKKLTQQECKKLFKGKTPINGKNPIYPVRLSFRNNSDKTLFFNESSLEMPLATEKEVLDKIKTRAWIRGLGIALGSLVGVASIGVFILGIPALFISPFFGYVAVETMLVDGLMILGCGSVGAGSIYLTKTSINNNSKINKNLKSNYTVSTLVKPHETTEILIFLKKEDLKDNLNIELFNSVISNEVLNLSTKLL